MLLYKKLLLMTFGTTLVCDEWNSIIKTTLCILLDCIYIKKFPVLTGFNTRIYGVCVCVLLPKPVCLLSFLMVKTLIFYYNDVLLVLKGQRKNLEYYVESFRWINGNFNLTCVYRASYCNVLMTNEMHNSYNQFYSTFFCLLYMFRKNLVVHHQEHSIIYCNTQYNRYNRATNCTVCVIQYIMPCSWWWTTGFFRNMQSRQKKLWNKNLL